MNKDNEMTTQFGQEKPKATRCAIRCFILRDATSGWQKYPQKHAMEAYRGKRNIPKFRSCSIWVSFAHVDIFANGSTILHCLECWEWTTDTEGMVDLPKMRKQMTERIYPEVGVLDFKLLTSVPITFDDIAAIRSKLNLAS
jgi:hypothetical protein